MDRGYGNDFPWREGARHAHDGVWGGPLHLIVILLLVGLVVLAVVWLLGRRSSGVAAATALPGGTPTAGLVADPAVAALRMRYASGEVSREDFRNGMEDLTGAAAPWPGSGPGDETASTENRTGDTPA